MPCVPIIWYTFLQHLSNASSSLPTLCTKFRLLHQCVLLYRYKSKGKLPGAPSYFTSSICHHIKRALPRRCVELNLIGVTCKKK